MDNKQKIVIAVLIAVVLLFVVALAVQSQGDEGDASSASANREGLLGSLGGDPAAVRLDELAGDCQRNGTAIVVQGSCGLQVQRSDERMRLVRLRNTGQALDVSAPAPEEAEFDIETELEPNEEVAIAVDKDGATIEFGCGFGQTCTLTLVGGAQ
jgi:hypothetical protein